MKLADPFLLMIIQMHAGAAIFIITCKYVFILQVVTLRCKRQMLWTRSTLRLHRPSPPQAREITEIICTIFQLTSIKNNVKRLRNSRETNGKQRTGVEDTNPSQVQWDSDPFDSCLVQTERAFSFSFALCNYPRSLSHYTTRFLFIKPTVCLLYHPQFYLLGTAESYYYYHYQHHNWNDLRMCIRSF